MHTGAGRHFEVILFARHPEAGRVKTRLAKDLGDENALRIYQALLAHTLETVRNSGYRNVLMVEPPDRTAEAGIWAPGMDLYLPQSGGDLGARMSDAVKSAFARGAERVLLLGCDCPQISKESLISSFKALEACDVVLGPCLDGGYYLLGLKEEREALFRSIPWSTGAVLEATLNILKKQTLSYILHEKFSDVDTQEDFERVRHLEPLKHLGIR